MNTLPDDIGEILSSLVGGSYGYRELYKAMRIPCPKSKHSRRAFIKELSLHCEIRNISTNKNRPKFLIERVYEHSLAPYIHKNNKFQYYIDQMILQEFKRRGMGRIYATSVDLLLMTSAVNENFRYALSPFWSPYLEPERIEITANINTTFEILHRWVMARIKSMSIRGLLRILDGFRLCREENKKMRTYMDVPLNTDLDDECRRLYRQAVVNVGLGEDWKHEWLPRGKYNELTKEIDRVVTDYFKDKNGWTGMRRVMVLDPLDNIKLIDDEINNLAAFMNKLNAESKRKIMETKRLDCMTTESRKKLVDETIDNKYVKVSYRDIAKENKRRRELIKKIKGLQWG